MNVKATLAGVLLAVVLWSCAAQAVDGPVDHLTPPETIEGYDRSLVQVFKSVFDSGETVTVMVAEPSFAAEYAVGTKEKDGRYAVFYTRATTQVWGYSGQLADVGEIRCQFSVPADMARRIAAAWTGMLRRIGPDDSNSMGVDGTIYRFSAYVGDRLTIGDAWSPPPDNRPGRLVGITDAMRELCERRNGAAMFALDQQVNALLKTLNEDKDK